MRGDRRCSAGGRGLWLLPVGQFRSTISNSVINKTTLDTSTTSGKSASSMVGLVLPVDLVTLEYIIGHEWAYLHITKCNPQLTLRLGFCSGRGEGRFVGAGAGVVGVLVVAPALCTALLCAMIRDRLYLRKPTVLPPK